MGCKEFRHSNLVFGFAQASRQIPGLAGAFNRGFRRTILVGVYNAHHEQRGAHQAVRTGGVGVAWGEGFAPRLHAPGARRPYQRAAPEKGFGRRAVA